uniref:Uncharacterized protein n=1 Tax=Tetradesmus obliquus TaxID=3088 RepID=A0A383VRZ9_TETOB|eukprot:jgi/Sobl393_1/16316/SZX67951.1
MNGQLPMWLQPRPLQLEAEYPRPEQQLEQQMAQVLQRSRLDRTSCDVDYYGSSRSSSSSSIVCRASSRGPGPTSSKLKRSVWTAVDVIALLGSVGGALAALLGLVAPTYALVLPLVLPVVSLIAALQREDLSNEEGRAYFNELSSSLGRDSAALLREASAAIEEVRRETRAQSAAAARLAAIEDKLAVLEGAAVDAGRSSREAAMAVNALGSALSQTLAQGPAGQQQQHNPQMLAGYVAGEVAPLLQAELAASLGPWLADSSNSLKRLGTRLAMVEGSLAGLEAAQSEGLMRLGGAITGSLVDAESALQNSVRIEVAAAVEPLKQLPQLVAAAAAKAAAQQQQQQQQQALQAEGYDGPPAPVAAAAVDQSEMVEQLRQLVAAEVATATQQILSQQAEVLASLSQPPKPAQLADDQWEALGRRLARLERLVQSVPELGEQAIAGQLAPLIAAQQQQQQQQQQQGGLSEVAAALAAAADQAGASCRQLSGLVGEFEGVRFRYEEAMSQLAAAGPAAAAAAAGAGTAPAASEQLVQQVQESLQQLLQQQQGQQQQGQQQQQQQLAGGGMDLSGMLLTLQQQVEGLAAALQQVQMDIPLQIELGFSQSAAAAAAAAAGRGDSAYDGAAFEDSSSSSSSTNAAAAAAAASASAAATAAAQGVSDVRQLLSSVQQTCEDIQLQVTALASQVAAQQAAILSSSSSSRQQDAAAADSSSSAEAVLAAAAATQQQLADISSQLSADLTQQLSGVCLNLEQQLQELQQQLVAAAAIAATQAAAEAAAAAAASRSQEQLDAAAIGSSVAAAEQQQQQQQQQQADYYAAQVAAGGWGQYQQQPQQQQQFAEQVMPAADRPAAAAAVPAWANSSSSSSSSSSSYASPEPAGSWPADAAAAAAAAAAASTPQEQQQFVAASPSPAPAAPQQQPPAAAAAAAIPDITTLSEEQLRTEGLRLLRSGRAATSGSGSYSSIGPDFAAAEALLQAAVGCFAAAVESEPQDTRALGNLGNALLAQGELKKGLLDELRLSAAAGGLGAGLGGPAAAAAQSLQLAEGRLRSEAVGLLTRAGEIFRRVLEVDGWSSRALVNWGKALVGRAELAIDASAATKLYNAAIDKFEAVLEEDPELVVAKYRCALAMQGLAGLSLNPAVGGGNLAAAGGSSSSRQRLVLLGDAGRYLADVVAAAGAPGGDEGLRDAAAAALRQVTEQLELSKLS